MGIYLTNTSLSNEALCLEAAKNTGFKVEFEREPMPYTGTFDDEGYCRERLVGTHGCVISHEPVGRCHSVFWREWDRLRDLGHKA